MSRRGLTNKQRAFIEHYLTCWNASEAARRAGYSLRTAYSIGDENLKKPEIAAEIKRRINELKMTADEVFLRYSEQARGEYAKYILPSGRTDIGRIIADGKAHLIKSITPMKEGDKVEFYDSQTALAQIGRALSMFTDNVKHEGQVEIVMTGNVQPDKL